MNVIKKPANAQGTTEYLVIVGVVVVIGLVVVGFMTNFLGSSSSANDVQSKAVWLSQSVGIVDSSVDWLGTGYFSVKNNSGGKINVTSFMVDSVQKNIALINQVSLEQGETHVYIITGITPCSSGYHTYLLQINYIPISSGIGKKTNANKLSVSCTSSTSSVTALFGIAGNSYVGAMPLSDGSGNWLSSGTDVNGIIAKRDLNGICFGGIRCDANIGWDGNDIVFAD